MKRRQLLSAIGAVGVAGCVGDETSDTDPTDNGWNQSQSQAPTQTTEPDVDVSVSDVSIETRTTAVGNEETAVTGLVENTGDARLAAVNATGKFYNADDQLLSSGVWDVRDFEPGEVWEPWISYAGDGTVAEGKLVISDTIPYSRIVNPTGIEVKSENIEIPTDDYADPRVSGTVANNSGRDVPYLQARPKVADENGHLLETAITSVNNLGAGETWSFDQAAYFANPSWRDRISRYKIVLTL